MNSSQLNETDYNGQYYDSEQKLRDMPATISGAKREKLNNLRYDYLPAKCVNEAYARVATFGAKKYDVDNWKKGLPQSQISASLQRHLWAYMEGENFDKESGLSHLDHVLWNAVALVYNESQFICDDRFQERCKRFESQEKSSLHS